MTDSRQPLNLQPPLTLGTSIPLGLYIHFPWCVQKCPYCDFNSHGYKDSFPEEQYIDALIRDCEQSLPLIWGRPIHTIFMGGGTPSLISGKGIDRLMSALRARLTIAPNIEITLEANPGTVERQYLAEYFDAGVNRLSIGCQSFDDNQLAQLGRIHRSDETFAAIEEAKRIGYERINLDIMYGLPDQTVEQAMADLDTAMSQGVEHISWYQLTLEPQTPFYYKPPPLPGHDSLAEIQFAGQSRLKEHGYGQYEISAYTQMMPCFHNMNYWQFGDYLGLGAGAHGKISFAGEGKVMRQHRVKYPNAYMEASNPVSGEQILSVRDLQFEVLLNGLRLKNGMTWKQIAAHTGLDKSRFDVLLSSEKKHLLIMDEVGIRATPTGYHFLDEILADLVD